MSLAVHVRYDVEAIDVGWLVWRTVDGRDPEALSLGRRARVYESVQATRDAVWRARVADRAAATRLGIDVVEEIHD